MSDCPTFSTQFGGICLINAVTAEVRTSRQLSDFPTNQDLRNVM